MTAAIGLASLAALVWLWLVVARGMFWRTDVRLPDAPAPDAWPPVAVVVPARDEADVLPHSLPGLLAQDYPGRLRVVLVDDGSGDGTGSVAAGLAAGTATGLAVVSPGPPPPGWAGKLWAVRAGIVHAGYDQPGAHPAATGSGGSAAAASTAFAAGGADPTEPVGGDGFLLLTDADIAHRPDSLRRLVAFAVHRRLDLVSQMARLRTHTGWERLIVPAFVYFFALLYPFRWSNRPGGRTAAAAGGCVLVRPAALAAAGGIEAIRGAVIDDVALARAVKRAGGRTWLGLADRVDSVRPYPDLASLWQMVARSAYAQLRYSPVLLAGTVLGLALVFLVPPAGTVAGALTGTVPLLAAGAAGWLLMAGSFVPMLRYYGQPAVLALALPATATLYLAMTVDSARRHWRGRGGAWKGRTYG